MVRLGLRRDRLRKATDVVTPCHSRPPSGGTSPCHSRSPVPQCRLLLDRAPRSQRLAGEASIGRGVADGPEG